MKPKSTLRYFLLAAGSSLLAISSASAQSGNWNFDGSDNWSNALRWSSNPTVPGNAAGDTVNFTNNISAATRTITINTTPRIVGVMAIGDSNNTHGFAIAASGGGTLTFDNSGSGATLTEAGSVGDAISAPIILADNLLTTVGGSLTLSGGISQTGGARSLTKAGAGTLILTSNPTYTGATILNGGTLDMSSVGTTPLNSSSGITFTGSSIFLHQASTTTLPSAQIDTGVTGVYRSGANGGGGFVFTIASLSGSGTFSAENSSTGQGKTWAITDLSSFTGVLQFNGQSATQINVSNINDTVANNIRFNGATSNSGSSNATNNLNYVGSAGLTLTNRAIEIAHSGASYDRLNNNGTSSSAFTINSDLVVSGTGAKALTLGGTNTTGLSTFAGKIVNGSGTVNIIKADSNTWSLTGTSNTYTGGTAITAGVLEFANGALGTTGTINASGGTLRWGTGNTQDISSRLAMNAATTSTFNTNGNNVTFATAFGSSTTGALTKTGAGTLSLERTNTYTGATTVSGGTLQLSHQLAIQSSTLTMNGGTASIAFDAAVVGKAFTVGGLAASTAGTGYNIALENTSSEAIALTVGGNNAGTTYAAVLSGGGSLIKTGSGTLILSGTSTYSGGTTISAGAIQISADANLGNSSGGVIFNGGSLSMGNSAITSSRNITVNDSIVGTMGSFSGGNGGSFTHNGNLLGGTTSTFVYRAANDNRLTLNGTGGFSGTLVVQGYAGARDGVVLNNAAAISDSNAAIRVGIVGATTGLGFNGGFRMGSGVATALTFNNRYIEIANNMSLVNDSSTSGRTLTFTKAFQVTATTNSTLNLGGLAANGVNVLSGGGISNGVGSAVTSLTVNANQQGINQTSNWAIGGTNTYSGNTTIVAGTLRLDSSLAMQNSALDTTTSAAGSATAGLRFGTGVTAVTLGGLIGDKNFATSGGTVVISTSGSNYGNITALTLNPGTGANHSYTGVIANGAAAGMTLTKTGAGTQILGGINTYTGATNVNAGTLQLNGSTHANSTMAVGTAGTLTGTGNVLGNATLTGGGIINKSSGTISGTLGVTGGNWNGAGTVTGLVTSSSGTFTIGTGANLTASSGVSLTGGGMVINGTLTGNLTANSSTTVSGSGTVTGNATISGTHSPGNSPGIQPFGGNLTYEAGSTVIWELVANSTASRGSNYDGINVGGTLDFNGATTLALNFDFGSSLVDWADTFWAVDYTGTAGWLVYSGATDLDGFGNLGLNAPTAWLDESGDLLSAVRPGASFSLIQDGNNVYLNYQAIPEPHAALLGGLGLLLMLRRRR